MTKDDEEARAVQEGLAGVRMCPKCDRPMISATMLYDGKPCQGWFCGFICEVYMLDNGTRVERPKNSPVLPVDRRFTIMKD